MKPTRFKNWHRSVLRIAAMALAAQGAIAAEPAFISIDPFYDEFGSGGSVDLKVVATPQSTVTLQYKDDLPGSEWQSYGVPTFITSTNPVVFSVPTVQADGVTPVPHRFFRFNVEASGIDLKDDGDQVVLRTRGEISPDILVKSLSLRTGSPVFAINNSGNGALLPPLTTKGSNLEDALADAGLHLWTLPAAKDDARLAGRLIVKTGLQEKALDDLPGDIGKGVIEEGFEGIPGRELPRIVLRPIPPESNQEKGLKLEVPEITKVLQAVKPGVVDPLRHIRFGFEIGMNGGLIPKAAFNLAGDSLPTRGGLDEESLPVDPPVGSIIYLVRSDKADRTHPNGIYFIGAEEDPFVARAYQPPYRGSHGHVPLAKQSIRLNIPLLPKDLDLAGLRVEVYRYVKPTRLGVLSPERFLKTINSFQQLGAVNGDELSKLVATTERGKLQLQDLELAGVTRAATLTQLHNSGPRSKKFNMVIIAEGFADTTTDQDRFNDYVNDTVMTDLFGRDVHPEILNAINVFRINTYSKQSGVTTVNGSGSVTSSKDTALGYRFSGDWNRCWMESGPGTEAAIDALINTLIPEANVKAVVLNTASFGGCSRGHHFAVTRGVDWSVFAHEFGHFFGKQGDEYQCNQGSSGCGSYSGSEPGAENLTKTTSRNSIEWKDWIPVTRPVPTALANVVDTTQDVGLFPGATIGSGQWWTGIYRPSWRGRMNNNSPVHNPVGYSAMRENARARQDADFRKSVVGDFNGDGRTDTVILDDRQLSLYLAADRNTGPNDPVTGQPPRPVTGVLEPTWYHTDILYNAARNRSWEFRGSDILIPADFDGDGKTDLIVANLDAWNTPYLVLLKSFGNRFEPVRRFDRDLPGWGEMRAHDKFYAGDFDGDGKTDLMVYNGQDWSMPYFLMLKSTGSTLNYVRRYDRYIGWEMGDHEKFFVGDYDGDGRQDIIAQNTDDWNKVHLMIFRSTGTGLSLTDRHYGEIRINDGLYWTMRDQDELFTPNFNGDKTSDLAIFNGRNWSTEYLGMFALLEGKLSFRQRYSDSVPGWNMRSRDRFFVADVNGDGKQDLVVYNSKNWSTQYLGMLRSNSTGSGALSGSWQADWIGSWNLGDSDSFHVADFRGAAGWDDLFVFNKNWFGLLRSYSNRYQLEAIYPKWIHNHRYHAYGWW